MNSYFRFGMLGGMLLVSGCYDYDSVYTTQQNATIALATPTQVYADSATLQKVTIAIPGLQAQRTQTVTVTTDWGQWSNKSQTVTLTASNVDNEAFTAETDLIPARTVQPFTITASANGQEWKASFRSIPRYPSRLQLIPDSLALNRKVGTFSRVRLYAFSDVGFPSYGLRFFLTTNQNASLLPAQLDYAPSRQAATRVTLLTATPVGDTLVVSARVADASTQPAVVPAKIILRR